MVHPLSYDYNATAQIALAKTSLPNLRLFQVGRQVTEVPQRKLRCRDGGMSPPMSPGCAGNGSAGLLAVRNTWTSASQTAPTFSAVCFLTALELMRTEIGIAAPVGLIESDWGGSNQHPWQSAEFATNFGCPMPVFNTSNQLNCSDLPANFIESPIKANCWRCTLNGMILPLSISVRPMAVLWYVVPATIPVHRCVYC
jgi:hypothetical protein